MFSFRRTRSPNNVVMHGNQFLAISGSSRLIKMLLKFLIVGFVATAAVGQNIDATIDDVFGTPPPKIAPVPSVAEVPSGSDTRVGDEKVRKLILKVRKYI